MALSRASSRPQPAAPAALRPRAGADTALISALSRSQLVGKQFDLIPHTGVEVYGVEYFFGGGVQALPPATVEATFGLKPCEVLPLGSTAIPKEIFEEFLNEIAPRFTGETYNLFTHNCNNFSNELAQVRHFPLSFFICVFVLFPCGFREFPESFSSHFSHF